MPADPSRLHSSRCREVNRRRFCTVSKLQVDHNIPLVRGITSYVKWLNLKTLNLYDPKESYQRLGGHMNSVPNSI